MSKQLYEYAVILQEKKATKDGPASPAEILVEPTTVLAADANEVNIIASRAIPEEHIGELERVTLAVRPF